MEPLSKEDREMFNDRGIEENLLRAMLGEEWTDDGNVVNEAPGGSISVMVRGSLAVFGRVQD